MHVSRSSLCSALATPTVLSIIVGGMAALVAGGLFWRSASRRRSIPCPHWLGWILDNPYTAHMTGSERILDLLQVSPGMRVLDVGAGRGRVTLPAARRVGDAGQVVALDVQPAMLERVAEAAQHAGLQNVRTCAADVTALAHADVNQLGYFDSALLATVLGELPDAVAGLEAIHGLLRDGGALAVVEMLPDPHYVSRGRVSQLAASAGFDVERVVGGRAVFTAILRKRARESA